MSVNTRRCIAVFVIAALTTALTAACSPALNWRKVSLQGLDVLLPCKPDYAERKVQLGALDAVLRMSGCEAAGALYAVSHLQVVDLTQVDATKSAWRQATFSAMQVTAQTLPPEQPDSTGTIQAQITSNPEQVEGKRPDGSAVQAQFVWLNKGQDIYQVAVYASKLDKEKTELLFSELRLR